MVAGKEQLLHHLFRVAQRRYWFDVEREARPFLPFLFAAQADVGHLKLIVQAVEVDRGDVDRLAGPFEHGQVLPTVVGADSPVLDDAQRHMEIDVGHGLGKPGKVLDIVVDRPPSLVGVGIDGERCIGPSTKVDLVLVELHAVLAVGAGHHHFPRQRGPGFIHHPGWHLDQATILGSVLDDGPTRVGNFDTLFLIDANARLI